VFAFALGLQASVNNFKPSEEEEERILFFNINTTYHCDGLI